MIPLGTEINTCLIKLVILEIIPDVAVFIDVMKIVVTLKQTVMFEYPIIAFADVRLKNGGGDLAVIVWS